MLQRAVRLKLEGGLAAGGEIGIEGLGELEIDGAAGGEIELLRAFQRKAPLRAEIGVVAGDMEGIEMDCAAGQGGVRVAFTFERHTGDGDSQLPEVGIAAKLFQVRERTIDRDRSGEGGVGAEGIKVSHAEKSANVEVGEFEAGLRCVAGPHRRLAFEVEIGSLQLGGCGVNQVVTGGVRGDFEDAECLST